MLSVLLLSYPPALDKNTNANFISSRFCWVNASFPRVVIMPFVLIY